MTTLPAHPRAVNAPRRSVEPSVSLRVRPGLVAFYDIPVAFAIAIGAVLTLWGGENLLKFRDWMLPHVGRFMGLAVGVLALLALTRLLRERWVHGPLTRDRVWAVFGRHLGWRVMLRTLRLVIALEIVLLIYTTIKQRFTWLNPGLHDELLIQIERWAHLGWNPAWSLAEWGWPTWTLIVLDYAYVVWFPFKFFILTYAITMANRAKRDRFLFAYLGMWPVAVLLGLMIPSAGPFFVEQGAIFPAGTTPVSEGGGVAMFYAAKLQALLQVHYLIDLQPGQSGVLIYGYGLMAMPSLHVTAVVLYALFGWGEGRIFRGFTLAFAGMIFLGSLLSGWHYAIDGYAGAAIAATLWFGGGVLQKWLTRRGFDAQTARSLRDPSLGAA